MSFINKTTGFCFTRLSHLQTRLFCNSSDLGSSKVLKDRLIKGKAEEVFFGSQLELNSIQSLLKSKIKAIVIPNFLSTEICKLSIERLLKNGIEDYTNAPGIGRVGISYYETLDSQEMKKKYFTEAPNNRVYIRQLFSPYESPLDKFKSILDEIWPSSVSLEISSSQKMFSGLIRSLENGKGILPHEDKRERDDPTMPELNGQLAMNVYLQNPEAGGELELYDLSFDTSTFDELRGDSYGIDRVKVGPPVMSLKPHDGDLILFNPKNLHAVSDVFGKMRVSISTFVGQAHDGSLRLWS